jgi:hypothetical protein
VSFLTFFAKVLHSFERLLENSRKHYSFIYIICIVSDPHDDDLARLRALFQSLNVAHVVEDYTKYIPIFEKINDERLHHKGYQNMAEIYNNTKGSIQTIMAPTHHSYYPYKTPFGYNVQWHQLQIGIDHLFEYETSHSMRFNFCMRMRFDTFIIDPEFYPHCPQKDILSNLTFNDAMLSKLKGTMAELNIHTIEEYAQFLKNNPIKVPDYISSYPESSFGCYFFNNYISIENIIKGEENILYSFVDHLFFGTRDVFVKLRNFFSDYGTLESDLNQKGAQAFFCPEAQLLVFCFHNNVNPLIYTHHSLFQCLRD